jgi:hypothetical protein
LDQISAFSRWALSGKTGRKAATKALEKRGERLNELHAPIRDKKGSQLPICDFVAILLLANCLAKVSS